MEEIDNLLKRAGYASSTESDRGSKSNNNEIVSVNDDEIGVLIGEIRQKFIHVDERALDDEENWWSVILEQVEDGLA